ncbi:hypothetical protein ES703_75499 [subsurface metagenome]|jgi:hypothetical protein
MIDIFDYPIVASSFIFDFISFILSAERKNVASYLVVKLTVEK